MKFQYFDIHGHVNFPAFKEDRDAAIKRAQDSQVGMITVGTDVETSKSSVALAEKTEGMWATVGLHPMFAGESVNDPMETGKEGRHMRPKEEFDHEAFKKLAAHPKVVGIGECGFELFHSGPEYLAAQRELFEQHIQLANEVNKPLMLHVRNPKSGGSAYIEAVKILKEKAKVRANFHFFAGTLEDAKAAVDAGCTLSFTGVITFARNYDEVIRNNPLESIMSETDCPYVAPAPFRGKRNEPAYVVEVVKKIAQIRGEAVEKVSEKLADNAREFFGI